MPRHTLLLSGAEVAQEVAEIAPRAVTLLLHDVMSPWGLQANMEQGGQS